MNTILENQYFPEKQAFIKLLSDTRMLEITYSETFILLFSVIQKNPDNAAIRQEELFYDKAGNLVHDDKAKYESSFIFHKREVVSCHWKIYTKRHSPQGWAEFDSDRTESGKADEDCEE